MPIWSMSQRKCGDYLPARLASHLTPKECSALHRLAADGRCTELHRDRLLRSSQPTYSKESLNWDDALSRLRQPRPFPCILRE